MVLLGKTYGFVWRNVWFRVAKGMVLRPERCALRREAFGLAFCLGVAGRAMALLLSVERAAMPCRACFRGWRKGEDGGSWLNFVKSIGGGEAASCICL